ncbi:MAG: hypothetical protein J5I35_00700 [Methanothrix harundinacea]|nr:hypothetical protein [Methanothrix harundinacea]
MMDKNNRIQDQMLDRQDETTGEVRGLRSDLKESLDFRLRRMEADLGEGLVGPEGEGDPLTASRPHLRLRPKDRRGPSGTVDGSRCGRISSGGGRGRSRRISRGHFLLIWIVLGRGLFRLVGSRTSGLGRRLVPGRAGGGGRFWMAAYRKRVAPADGWWWWGRSAIVGRSRPPSFRGPTFGRGPARGRVLGGDSPGSKGGPLRDRNSDV